MRREADTARMLSIASFISQNQMRRSLMGASATAPTVSNDKGGKRAMSPVPTILLNDGHTIPQLGFGVFQIKPDDTATAVALALEAGYRHVDTAEMYGNESGVGKAVRASGLDRADVFITSKLNNAFHRPDDARRAFETTLSELGL